MSRRLVPLAAAIFFLIASSPLGGQPKDGAAPVGEDASPTKDRMAEKTFTGLKLRLLGPAITSGRVVGFAVHPRHRSHYFVAAASGGVWKTTNAGTTWTPVFDNEGSYSIGTVVLDPKNPNVVWVGA